MIWGKKELTLSHFEKKKNMSATEGLFLKNLKRFYGAEKKGWKGCEARTE